MNLTSINGDGISFDAGRKNILKNIKFSFRVGDVSCILGQNGSGKSTLLKIVARIIEPSSGVYADRPKGQMCYVPAEFSTFFEYSIEYFMVMELYRFHLGFPRLEHFEKCRYWLKKFLIHLNPKENIATLSSGELKIVLLARAFAADPDFYILDEPSTHLDLVMLEKLKFYIKKMDKKTFIIVDHNEKFLSDVGNKFFHLKSTNLAAIPGVQDYVKATSILIDGV